MVLSQFNGKSGLFTFDKVSLIINVAAGLRPVLAECSAPFAESTPPRIDPSAESASVYMGFILPIVCKNGVHTCQFLQCGAAASQDHRQPQLALVFFDLPEIADGQVLDKLVLAQRLQALYRGDIKALLQRILH